MENSLSCQKIRNILKKEFPNLRRKYKIKKIGLFGSFAKGQQKKRSDVDLFIEFEGFCGLDAIRCINTLKKLLRRKVDVITPCGLKSIRIKKFVIILRKKLFMSKRKDEDLLLDIKEAMRRISKVY